MPKPIPFIAGAALLLCSGQSPSKSDEAVVQKQKSPKTYEETVALTRATAGFENLKQIGLALHAYHDLFGHFPPAVVIGPDGKTAHSWRVELLPVLKYYVDGAKPDPFLGGKVSREAYDKAIGECGYDIMRAWWDAKNRSALEAMPSVYRHPNDRPKSSESFVYAVVGEGTTFSPDKPSSYVDIKAWPATTLMLVESRSREPWTKPIDISYSDSATVPRFGGFTTNGFLALSADGAVHFVSDEVSPDELRKFISKDPGQIPAIPGIPYRFQ